MQYSIYILKHLSRCKIYDYTKIKTIYWDYWDDININHYKKSLILVFEVLRKKHYIWYLLFYLNSFNKAKMVKKWIINERDKSNLLREATVNKS